MRMRPYTLRGLRRMRCEREGCNNRAENQWQICADGNQFRRICNECDVEINAMVLYFMGWPDAREKLLKYAQARIPGYR